MFRYENIVMPYIVGESKISSKGELLACCPFHLDKHPSFNMNLESRPF